MHCKDHFSFMADNRLSVSTGLNLWPLSAKADQVVDRESGVVASASVLLAFLTLSFQ